MAAFAALDPRVVALLLDFDGTLVEIAPTPDAVHVSDDLRASLICLLEKTGGALALVSGRPIADLDRFFAPLTLPIVGGHGAEMRVHGGETIDAAEPLPESLRRRLADAAMPGSGVLIEDKGYSVALHYRQAPQEEERLHSLIAAARAAFPREAIEILPGKAMFEVKRPGVSKGEAVRTLMTYAPFAGRKPVFIGDDVTDESVFAMLPSFGGMAFSVQRPFTGLAGIFTSPAQVRRALAILAASDR
jgi:trehalose 6-phosphate phosphatase